MTDTRPSVNRALLVAAATALRPFLDEVVFVGGLVAELLITHQGAARIRPTSDADVIAAVTTASQYDRLSTRLRASGLRPDRRHDAPLPDARFDTTIVTHAVERVRKIAAGPT